MIDFEFEFQYAEEKQPTLQKVGGSIPAGRCVALCGGSGCGKSTLLRCINGLIPQFYEGELKGFCRLNGQDTAGIRIGEIGELAASVFQDPRSQFFTVNSSNEVAFGLENHGLPQDKIRRRVDEAFRIFHLERLKDRNVYELSSGERQLISILSAWAMDTDIFLLDEPTANLDFAATQQLKEILLALKKQGKTLLLSEHRLYYLADIADEFWVMADGEIKGKYTAAEAKAFSAERRQTLSLRTLDLAEITVPEKEPLPKTAPTALAVSDVCYTYGRKAGDTLSGVSFSVREHEIVGLVGANGCGKTTIGKLIAGLYRPSGGRIMLFGKSQNPKQLQKQVLFILQEAEFQFFTGSVLHELQYGHAVTPEFEAKTEALLKSMDMWDCRNRHPFSLSGGQMQRLTLMMAYLSDKPIVILDEPTAGQDAESLERCAALIREMRKEKTVLIITHDLELALKTADKIVVFYAGTAVEEADTVDFNREAALRHPYTRALFRAMPEHGFAPEPGIQPYVRDLPEGCPYGPRCPKYKTECSKEVSYVPYQGGLVRCICPGDENEILPGILSGPAGLKGQMTSEQITSEQMASGQRSGEYNAWGKEGVSL